MKESSRTESELLAEISTLKQKNKEYAKSLFANSYIPLIVMDAETGIYIDCNEPAVQIYGYNTREDVLGKTPLDVSAPIQYDGSDSATEAQKHIKICREKGSHIFEWRHQRTNGQIWDAYIHLMLLQYREKSLIQFILQDITDRKRMEENLRESEEKYRTVVEQAAEGIAIAQDDCFAYVNPKVADDMLGVPFEKLVGKPFGRFVHPEDRDMVISRHRRRLVGESLPDSYEFRFIGKGKRLTWVRLATKQIQWNGRPATLNMYTDVTERKQAEEALRQSEATLRSVFKATPIGLCIIKDRVLQSSNNAWCESTGYSESDIIGHTTRIFYEDDEEYERVGRELYADLSERDLNSVQIRFQRKDGVIRDAIVTAAFLQSEDPSSGMVVSIEDITDRKRTERKLKENRRLLADIIEFLPDATFVINNKGRVIAWNRAIESMTGVKKKDMLGKGKYEYSLPFYGERRPTLIDLALRSDREMEKQYKSIQRVDDILYVESYTPNLPPGNGYLSVSSSVLRDANGKITAAIACIRDNTERKKLEEHLNRAEKMEALGTLAGGVAHDLNNVLGVLVGYSELLRDGLQESNRLRKYADNILQSGVRGAAIVSDLLTLARRGVSISEVVDLNRSILNYLRTPEFEKLKVFHPNVKIRTELEDGLLNIKGSPIHLGKTIMNLISNAAEAISDHGEVTIRTANCYLDHPIRGYDTMQEGDYALLIITDTGMGISANDLGKIFEPFYTKKVMGRSGTGLGLAVVWGTVKDHNGYIDVQSEEGKGTTFTLYFPVTREDPVKVEKAISPIAYRSRGESILVVDDVKEQRELATNMLGKLGYQVAAVASGEKAIEYLKNKQADLIVLDMIMDPGIDGMETYRRIREINPGQKAVIVSGFSETDRVRNAQEMGAGAFVRKPYVLEKIGLAVRKELDRR